jgi:hypothetical protein
MASIQSFLAGLFGRKHTGQEYKIAEVYKGLRSQVFGTNPTQLGLAQSGNSGSVWGMVMETGYPTAVASLVVIGDGTVSMYFSNGGGTIGLGQNEEPRKAGQALLAQAPQFVSMCQPTAQYPLPLRGQVRFYILTFDGAFTAEAKEEDLGRNRHALSPLFYKANDVISAWRLLEEQQKAAETPRPQ